MRDGTRLKFLEHNSYMLLRYLFMTEQPPRNIKKKDLFDELIRRGVAPNSVSSLVDDIYWTVGNAADNRMPWEDDTIVESTFLGGNGDDLDV